MAHNPPGFVPNFGQGIMAEAVQEGVSGGKRWLKTLKLHKYWPTFSHWTYAEVMSLTPDTVDIMIAATGSSGMTDGAKGRLLKSIEKLRMRQTVLNSLAVNLECQLSSQDEAIDYLAYVVDTPLPTNPHDTLPLAIVLAVIEVYDYISRKGNEDLATKQMGSIMQIVMKNRVLRSAAITIFCNETEQDSIGRMAQNFPGFVSIFGQGLKAEAVQKGESEMAHDPPGFVPIFGQGLMAEAVQDGVSGGEWWLKSMKLHKYWPTFSHWTYAEVMSLTPDNVDIMIASTGSSGMTDGAKGRLLKCVEKLRSRQTVLKNFPVYLEYQILSQNKAIDYLAYVVDTPLPTNPYDTLPLAIVLAVIEVYDYIRRNGNEGYATKRMGSIIRSVMKNRVLRSATVTLLCNQTESRLHTRRPFETVHEIQRSKIGALSEQRRGMESAGMRRSQIFIGGAAHESNLKRITSSDSGFEELDIPKTESFRKIWPIGENTVMFNKTAPVNILIAKEAKEQTMSTNSPDKHQSAICLII